MNAAAKIGLFALIGLIILGFFILRIENLPLGSGGDVVMVEARFASAAGVDRKAPVRIAGVRVGQVERIRLDGQQAVLEISLDPAVRLHEGASAQVVNMGILGDKYVEIVPGDATRPLLPAGTQLMGQAAPSIDEVMEIATSIGEDVKEVTAALRTSIGGDQGAEKITEIVDNIQELTATLKVLIAENQANVNETTANFRDVSATLRDELPVLAEKMNRLADQLTQVVDENRDNLSGSLENIRDLSGRLQTSADNLNEITTKMAAGEGTIGKLLNDETTVDNFNETLDSIEGGVDTLQDTVGRFRRFRLDMELRGEALPDISDSRYALGFDLWTTDHRFFRVEGVDAPFGNVRDQTTTTTTTYPDGSTETIIVEQSKVEHSKVLFNVQIGYRLFDDTVVRAGLFETSGGVGIDQHFRLWERGGTVSVEAYDWGREIDDTPHLRVEGRYYLNRNLFLTAGWDDPLFSDRSSVLFGGGVTWNDEDVKYSLGLAAGAAN
jgi:phospholipid/cholesterol/gamma-HCH transport system substrate-binding protein